MGIIMGQGILFHRLQKMIKTRKLDNWSNSKIIIPRIPIVTNNTSPPVPFKWTQFPVLGAYYITLNWDKVTFWSLLIYILIRGTSVWLHSLNQDAIILMSPWYKVQPCECMIQTCENRLAMIQIGTVHNRPWKLLELQQSFQC